MTAAKRGNVQATLLLLENGANIGLVTDAGETFFDIAINCSQEMVCKAVLESER